MSEFRSLYTALKGWYCRPLADYPNDLREWIVLGLGLGLKAERMHTWWEHKTPRARMAFAKQWDYRHDPATKGRRDDLEKFFDDHEKLERENKKWEGIPAPDALNLAKKDEMLVSLRAQGQEMNLKLRQMRGDLETTTPVMTALKDVEPGEKSGTDNTSLDNWMMKVQAEAASRWIQYRKMNCSPTKHSLKDELSKWCRKNGIQTKSKITPSPDYIYRHVLRKWTPPSC